MSSFLDKAGLSYLWTKLKVLLGDKQDTITGAATTITKNNLTASRALYSDANGKVAASAVTSTELGYLDGVTSNVQTQLNGKAASSHGTHVTFTTTAPKMDGTASAGTADTVSRSDHIHPIDTTRASKSEFDTHAGDTTKHITSTERTNWGTAYNHSQAAHAPSSAEKNIIVGIQKNGVDLTVNSSTRKVNITVPTTASDVGAAPATHGNHVPTTQTANNATFLRNDNTWQKVTPANIGAALAAQARYEIEVAQSL